MISVVDAPLPDGSVNKHIKYFRGHWFIHIMWNTQSLMHSAFCRDHSQHAVSVEDRLTGLSWVHGPVPPNFSCWCLLRFCHHLRQEHKYWNVQICCGLLYYLKMILTWKKFYLTQYLTETISILIKLRFWALVHVSTPLFQVAFLSFTLSIKFQLTNWNRAA